MTRPLVSYGADVVWAAPVCELGESPRWDDATGRLWWVDLLAGHVHSLSPRDGTHDRLDVGEPVTALARHQGGWVVAVERSVQYRDEDFDLVSQQQVLHASDIRLNDGALDPAGRFVVGSLSYSGHSGAGALFSVDDRGVRVLRDSIDISNGVAWSDDGRTFFHVDSGARAITAYAYDLSTGDIGDPRVFYRHPDDGAVPDGIALDSEGGLWVALWGGSRIVRIGLGGEVTDVVEVGARQPAGIAFGAYDLGTLYITSARVDLAEPGPVDGALFSVRTGATGQPQKCVRVTPTIDSRSSTRYTTR